MNEYVTGTHVIDGKTYKFRAPSAVYKSADIVRKVLDKLNAEIKLGIR